MKKRALYRDIESYLEKVIEKGKEGEYLPSQTQLTYKFKANHMTVRRAIGELEREGLIYCIKGKGTFIRKKRKKEKSLTLLSLFPSNWRESKQFCLPLVEGMIEESAPQGIHLHICASPGDPYEIRDLIDNYRFGGVIWVTPPEAYFSIMEKWAEKGYPIMVINRIIRKSWLNYVSTDHKRSMQEITEYLIKKGHKRIGFIGLNEDSYSRQRFAGFRESLEVAGIGIEEKGVIKTSPGMECSFQLIKKLGEKIERMLEDYMPEAILISEGNLLPFTLAVIRKKGLKIPENIEVANCDEVPPDYKEKEFIHEVIQPLSLMGKVAVREMRKIISGKKEIVREIFLPSVRIKEKKRRKKDEENRISFRNSLFVRVFKC